MTTPPTQTQGAQGTTVDHARLARGFSLQLVGKVLSILLSFISIAITIRYLGVDKYGILTAVVAFSGVFDAFSDIGLSAVTIRRASAGKDSIAHLVGINLGVSITYALPLFLVTSAAGFFVYSGRSDYQLGVLIVASSLLFRAVSTCYDAMFEVRLRFGPIALSDLLSRVLTIVLMVIAVWLDFGLVAFFAIQVLPTIVKLFVLVRASGQMDKVRPVFNRPAMISLVREGMPLAAVSLVAVLYYRADGVLLSLLSTERQLGSYGLGYRMAANLAVIPIVFAATVFPTLARLFAADRNAYNSFASRVVDVIALFAVPIGLFGALLTPEAIIIFASRDALSVATDPARLLFLATAVGFVNAVLAQCLIAAHDQAFLVRMGVIGLTVNIAINLAVDHRFGAAGAAWALMATESLGVTLALLRLRHVTGFRVPVAYTARLLLAAGVTLLIWLTTRDMGLYVALPLSVVAFVAVLMLDGPLRPSEIRGLIHMLRGRASVDTGLIDSNPQQAAATQQPPATTDEPRDGQA